MRNLTNILGFPADRSHVFRLAGRRYRVKASGEQIIELAIEMLKHIEAKQPLMPLRSKIRTLRVKHCTAILAHLVEATTDHRLRLIAIWLRGQCGGHIGTQVLARFAGDKDERTRAAVAKALQRLNDWTVLRVMSTDDTSERVRRLASPRVYRAFGTRLHDYAQCVTPIPVFRHERFLYLSPLLELQKHSRIKSAELIRRILERIRHLVSGGNPRTPPEDR